ncbi:hypothetical protein [Croceicoccus bisphenolivorans]|uniref:hypothetical protein n=1 Tax=Croceicoccus bisphenolivorans TaxID=1783232 RepID=UPI000AF61E44|nr:hypothetical protein [Croceicoccus bisphenolivorans]
MASKIVKIVQTCAVAGIATLSGCTPPPPPAPPPPPPPVVQAFPARPLAPGYAQDNLAVPPTDAMGIRQTVNTGLTSAQTTWNLRSAYNVAALNCQGPENAAMAERYGAFLKEHTRELSATNRALDSEFRQKYGPGYKDVRDRYMTQVYNYFALPPALERFCAAALNVSSELATVEKGNLDVAAANLLPQLESVFLNFFSEYEAYRVAATAWDASYLATYGVPYRRPGMNPLSPAANVPYGPDASTATPVPVAGQGSGTTGS